jgi:hypothetical protein
MIRISYHEKARPLLNVVLLDQLGEPVALRLEVDQLCAHDLVAYPDGNKLANC